MLGCGVQGGPSTATHFERSRARHTWPRTQRDAEDEFEEVQPEAKPETVDLPTFPHGLCSKFVSVRLFRLTLMRFGGILVALRDEAARKQSHEQTMLALGKPLEGR